MAINWNKKKVLRIIFEIVLMILKSSCLPTLRYIVRSSRYQPIEMRQMHQNHEDIGRTLYSKNTIYTVPRKESLFKFDNVHFSTNFIKKNYTEIIFKNSLTSSMS